MVQSAGASLGHNKLSTTLGANIPFAYLVCHLNTALLSEVCNHPSGQLLLVYYRLGLKLSSSGPACRPDEIGTLAGLLTHNLQHNLSGAGAIIKIDEDNLLPGTQSQLAVTERDD